MFLVGTMAFSEKFLGMKLRRKKKMKILSKILATSLLVSLPGFTQAQSTTVQSTDTNLTRNFTHEEMKIAQSDPKAYQIDPLSIRIVKLKEEKLEGYGIQTTMDDFMTKDEDLVMIDKIVNIAIKIWGLIKDNAPVVNISSKYATAVPQGIASWVNLTNWEGPKAYTYGFYAKNLYGVEVINVRYKVIYMYGGDYKGKGKYLTGVSIVPEIVDVAWAYRFDLNAQVPDSTIANVGSSENPMASMQLKLSWTIATMIKESQGTSIYYIRGDGLMQEIASPFKAEVVKMEDVEAAKVLVSDNMNKIFE
jgi:hypothetical protein